MFILRTLLIAVMLMAMPAAQSADPQSPLVGHSFPFFYRAANESGTVEIHRGVIVFSREGAKCELFPGGLVIPFTGTLKTQRVGKRGSVISDFSAKGEAPSGKGTVTFSANKDGAGAKGQVTLSIPGKEPVTLKFQGTRPTP